jgi:hypothetical protein
MTQAWKGGERQASGGADAVWFGSSATLSHASPAQQPLGLCKKVAQSGLRANWPAIRHAASNTKSQSCVSTRGAFPTPPSLLSHICCKPCDQISSFASRGDWLSVLFHLRCG